MAFTVGIAEEVVEYIRKCDRLSISDQDRILAGMVQELSESADKFLAKNPHPLHPNLFWYDFALMTEAHVVREFRFWCNAEGHVYGVTEVRYAEEHQIDEENTD
jgi:hypothetical protein